MREVLATAALLGACVHALPLTPQEQCGTRGMVVQSIGVSNGTADTIVVSGNGTAYASTNVSGEIVMCRPPTTQHEQCTAQVGAASARPKIDFGSARSKNALIFFGYYLLIVPGVILSGVFISKESDAETESRQASTSAATSCSNNETDDE